MNAQIDELELELQAEPRSVPAARHAVSRLARAAGANPDDVALAVSEAVSNAVIHGYRGSAGTIVVRAHLAEGHFVVEVNDKGVGMRPHPERSGLGMGLSLIMRLARDAAFDSSESGTTITMRFALAGSG